MADRKLPERAEVEAWETVLAERDRYRDENSRLQRAMADEAIIALRAWCAEASYTDDRDDARRQAMWPHDDEPSPHVEAFLAGFAAGRAAGQVSEGK